MQRHVEKIISVGTNVQLPSLIYKKEIVYVAQKFVFQTNIVIQSKLFISMIFF